jgi:hypothetical protein
MYKTEYNEGRVKIGFELTIYYKYDHLTVVLEMPTSSAKEVDLTLDLIPEAEWKALAWVENHGVTSEQMTFSIKGGNLVKYPCLGSRGLM